MKSKLILFSGKQGSGKDTIAAALSERLQRNSDTFVNTIKFAEPLYAMHDQIIKILKSYGITRDIAKDGPLLQLLGTEWGRNTIDKNIWVTLFQNRVKQIFDSYESAKSHKDCSVFIIATDCRFRNEFLPFDKALKIRLRCPEKVRKARCSMWRDATDHPSEVDLDEYDRQMYFNLYLDTDKQMVGECVEVITDHLGG